MHPAPRGCAYCTHYPRFPCPAWLSLLSVHPIPPPPPPTTPPPPWPGPGARARAGQTTFWAEAAPIPEPWPAEEVQLVQQRPSFVRDAAGADPEAPDAEAAGAAGGAPGLQAAHAPQGAAARRVVACHRGHGRIADHGFANARWVEGRLWVYDSGAVGLLWLGSVNFLVDLTPLLEPACASAPAAAPPR